MWFGFCPAGGKAVSPIDHNLAMMESGNLEDAAGNEEESVEVMLRRKPEMPSQKEVDDHFAANHVPFRDWCAHCVMGRAPNTPHRSVKKEEKDGVTTVSIDYAFLVDGKDKLEQDDPDGYLPMAVIVDHGTGYIWKIGCQRAC